MRVRSRIGAQALDLSQVTGTRWEVGNSRSAPVKWKSGRKRAGNYRLCPFSGRGISLSTWAKALSGVKILGVFTPGWGFLCFR